MFKMILFSCMVYIFMDISFAVSVKTGPRGDINNDKSIDNNAVLTHFLQLHRHHCGETATCGSSEHVEPSEFLIPVPCCVPCSCLPSCVVHQNCCPFSVNGSQKVPMATFGVGDIIPNNGISKSKTDMVVVASDSEVVSENETGQDKAGQHDLEDQVRNANGSETDTSDSGCLKVKAMKGTTEKCTRAQALYEPNRFIDSQAYMMVVTCPDNFNDKFTIDKCSGGFYQKTLLDMIPVSSKLSGVTYRNKYCLLCNENIQTRYVTEWRAEIVHSGVFRHRQFIPNPDTVVDTLKEKEITFCNLHFTPVDDNLTRRCNAFDVIISCNETGLWDIYDDLMERVCLEDYHLPIINRIGSQKLTFKNIGCLYCNMQREMNENQLSCGYWDRPLWVKSTFSVMLNLESIVSDDKNKNVLDPAPYIERDILQSFPLRRCQAGTIYLLGRCRRIVCPRDHYAIENQCVPLYATLKGLDLHLQIQVTPSRAIPGDISDAFEDNLKQMAVEILNDTVLLERRQFSLWYLPHCKANPTQYYLLDIYLFSTSNVIGYNLAVEQIKQFMAKFKSRANLAFLVPLNIKLEFQFKHGLQLRRNQYIDMTNGKTLQPLMKKGWALMTPGPNIAISEAKWCFRAVFDRDSELEDHRVFIRVKAGDLILFRDQYDKQQDLIYICVDLFVEQQNTANGTPTIKDIPEPVNDDNTLPDEIVVDYERGLILITSVIAIILLLVILYRKKNANERQRSKDSSISNQTQDCLELNVIGIHNSEGNMKLNGSEIIEHKVYTLQKTENKNLQ